MNSVFIIGDEVINLPNCDANIALSIKNANSSKISMTITNRIELRLISHALVPARNLSTTLGCKHGDQCHNINCKYICKNFVNSTCKFGDNCKFHHWGPKILESSILKLVDEN
jgi:hypothetical protein